MSFLEALRISTSGLTAQRARMKVAASNMANADTTRTPQGGPYRRRDVILATDSSATTFKQELDTQMDGVRVEGVMEDRRAPRMKFDPGHPDANADGFVALPNISVVEEMVNMMSATQSYQAGVTAIRAAKNMAVKALEIGK